MEAKAVLKPNGQKAAASGHPWVFGGGVRKVVGHPRPGQVVRLIDQENEFVAWGVYSPSGRIQFRVVGWKEFDYPDEDWWRRRLEAAVAARRRTIDDEATNIYRLINAEGDGLPGLIVDRFGGGLAVGFESTWAEETAFEIMDLLEESLEPDWIIERMNPERRRAEGLSSRRPFSRGRPPHDPIEVIQDGLRLVVDPSLEAPEGISLHHRRNRLIAAELAQGGNVLELYAYSGAFSLYCLHGGAISATAVDSSAKALNLGRNAVKLNDIEGKFELIQGAVGDVLRQYRAMERQFDLVIVDPPAMAPNRMLVDKAFRTYADLNAAAMGLVRDGGTLLTFCSSPYISRDRFEQAVFSGAMEGGFTVQTIGVLGPSDDFPGLLGFPESQALKGFVFRIMTSLG